MNAFENVISALESVFGNKMRSGLTMLGIIIGIGSVIMITSIGDGFKSSVMGEFSKMGLDMLQISMRTGTNEVIKDADYLRMDDLEVIKSHPEVGYAAPVYQASCSVRLKNPAEYSTCYVVGSTESYKYVQPVNLLYGRFIMDLDIDSNSPVVLIDEALSKKIFGRSDSVGEKINASFWFGHEELTVIGVVKAEDYGEMFSMPSVLYMPVTTIMRMYSSEQVGTIYVTVKNKDNMDRTALELSKLLSLKHKNENKYYVQNLLSQVESFESIMGNITAFIGFVAAISLLVGGIGVMNIMLVTVTERTREIGIRKSLGATDGSIKMQFLIEAVILTAIGGMAGILLGYYGSFAIGGMIKITPTFSLATVIGTVLISSVIGIVFGVYPAGTAAKLDPIEALRYE